MQIEPRVARVPLVSPGTVEHHVADMTATLAADVTLATVQEVLGRNGQWLPIDGDRSLPVGRLVEENSTGPLRLGFGAWRDLLTGIQFTSGRGELITAGGQTMKNVAGYDLTKLMVGSSGVFGKTVTLTTRTYRRPERALLAIFPPDMQAVAELMVSPARPQWMILREDELLCGYLGDQATVDFYAADVRRHEPLEVTRRSVDEDIAGRQELWRSAARGSEMAFRASVPPSRIKDFIKAVRPGQWAADAAFGIVVGTCPGRGQATAWQGLARTMSGRIIFRDPSSGALLGYAASETEKHVIQLLKKAFDPKAQLVPLPAGR